MNVAGSLLRRGLEVHATHGDKVKENFPVWGAILLGATAIVYVVSMFTIEYTFGRIIPTLLIIESPQDSIAFEPLPTEDVDSTLNKDPEPAARPALITSSFRRTLRHLGGFTARFRGLSVFIVNGLLINWIAGIFSILPIIHLIPRGLLAIVATVLCAQLSLTWTHIVISLPSQKTWISRLAPKSMWKKVAIPTAVYAAAQQIAVYVPVYTAVFSGLVDRTPEEVAKMPSSERLILSLIGIAIFLFGIVLALCIVVPANVMLTRVQASLLDDSEDTIVPFDRSFGGKVIPEIVGGTGVIGMRDAWKTFDWAARVRLIKAYLKVIAMQLAVTAVFFVILICQVLLIAGSDWSRFLPDDGNKSKVDV